MVWDVILDLFILGDCAISSLADVFTLSVLLTTSRQLKNHNCSTGGAKNRTVQKPSNMPWPQSGRMHYEEI
jgi:hypothetical protein